MEKLTQEEIGILVDALDAWVQRGQSGEMMGDLMVAILAKDSPEIKAKQEEKRRESARERQLDADTATLLKAKLIKMRQSLITA